MKVYGGTEAINYQSSRHLGLISVGNGKGLMGQYGTESINYPSSRHPGLISVDNGKGLMGQYGTESINYPSSRHPGLISVGNERMKKGQYGTDGTVRDRKYILPILQAPRLDQCWHCKDAEGTIRD